MSKSVESTSLIRMDTAAGDGAGGRALDVPAFSSWGQELLDRLQVAGADERKQCALAIRQEALDAAETLQAGARGLHEACALVAIQKLYLDFGYGSVEAWIQKEIVPILDTSKASVARLKSATRMYVQLAERFPGKTIRSGPTTVQVLEQEWRRQSARQGLVSAAEYAELERRVVEGKVPLRELESRLRMPREVRPVPAPGTAPARRPDEDSGQNRGGSSAGTRLGGNPHTQEANGSSAGTVRRPEDPVKELDALELRIRRPVPKRLTADCPAVELSRELERVLLEVERVPVHAWQDIPEEKLKDLAARAKASADVMEEAVGFLRASQSYDLEELDEEIVGAEDGGDDEDADPGGAPGRTSEVA